MRLTLLASLARRITNLYSRRWFRAGLLLATCILVIDLWLTVRVYGPRTRITALPASRVGESPSADVSIGGGGASSELGTGEGGKKEKLFIASIHWNDGKMLEAHWVPALLSLIHSYGASNLYISIHESGSWDNTKTVLRNLDSTLEGLGVERSVVLEERTHEDEIKIGEDEYQAGVKKEGWIMGRKGRREMRRIPYLAAARNKAMAPLKQMAQREGEGRRMFDRVVWLNDVIFSPDQLTTLLTTRNGSYSAVCALDFSESRRFYDTFAVRDTRGAPVLTNLWPFFSSPASRLALQKYLPTPVRSCWNGLVVFDAAPFYAIPPLEFRGIADSLAQKHVEGSECCLIHVDMARMLGGKDNLGVWINPNVRVGYNEVAFNAVNRKGGWPTRFGKADGVWSNRWHWATGWYWRWREKWVVEGAVRSWEREGGNRREEGEFCLADSMQVLVENGWMHI